MRERKNTTQHKMRQDTSRQDKIRQDKTRQDKTRQARQNKPSHPLPPDSLAKSKTNYTSAHSPLFLFKMFTNAHIHVFHPYTPSPTLSVISVQCCDSAHTRHEPLSTSSSGQKNTKREETKTVTQKRGVERASVLNGDSYHTFHFHQTSDLTPSHPTSTRLPTTATPDARKREGKSKDELTVYRSCVKLK